jgi:hypothetical protein
MPEYLPTPVQPIIPGSKYFDESLRSYVEPNMGVRGTLANTVDNTNTVQGAEALILALNRLLGTAPARGVRPTPGIPFLMDANPGIQPNVPSDAAYEQAVQIMKGAMIPANASQVDKVSALTKYMQQLGIPLQ